MQEDTEVVAVDPKLTADGIFVALFKKNFTEEATVALGHVVEDFADFLFGLFSGEGAEEIDASGGKVLLLVVVEGGVALRSAVGLEQDVVANGIDERAEALGLVDFLTTDGAEDAGEGFLADILDGLRRVQTGAEFELNQFAEVGDKMLLRAEITGTETLEVRLVK